MKLVPYKPWHYEYLSDLTWATNLFGKRSVQLYAAAYYTFGTAITVSHNGNIVGCAGAVEMWPGVGEFWSIFTDELRASPLFLHRTALRVVADAIQMYGFYRTQATVKLDDPVAMKWIERLGFRQESVMKKFSPDRKDVGMYVRHD